MQGANRSGEEGTSACYVTPDLSYDWREREKKGEDNERDGEKIFNTRSTVLLTMP